MKILWIHGRTSNINKLSWQKKISYFSKQWLELVLYQFDRSDDPTYKSWESTFSTIDFKRYDAVYTSSLWWAMLTKYILDNNIYLNKVIMCVPWISHDTFSGIRPNIQALFDSFIEINLNNLVNTLYVIHATDDEIVPYKSWKDFAEQTWATFISVKKWWHALEWSMDLIIEKLKE